MTFPSFADGMPDERTSVVMKAAAGKGGLYIALRVSSALGSAQFLTRADVGGGERRWNRRDEVKGGGDGGGGGD